MIPDAIDRPRSPDPATIVHSLYEAVDACDWDLLATLFTNDCRYDRPGYEPIKGLPELLRFYRDVRIIRHGHHTVHHVTADEHAAACWGHFAGISRTDQVLDEQFADVFELIDDRIHHRTTFFFRPAV